MLTVHILIIPIPVPLKFPAAQIQHIFERLEIVENLIRPKNSMRDGDNISNGFFVNWADCV